MTSRALVNNQNDAYAKLYCLYGATTIKNIFYSPSNFIALSCLKMGLEMKLLIWLAVYIKTKNELKLLYTKNNRPICITPDLDVVLSELKTVVPASLDLAK